MKYMPSCQKPHRVRAPAPAGARMRQPKAPSQLWQCGNVVMVHGGAVVVHGWEVVVHGGEVVGHGEEVVV